MISVIVPVYKAEKYLGECVDSILGQSYRDLEVILVDDGSPDSCPSLCNAYSARDSRVKVIHKKNGGVSTARNAGLEAAKGEYITFVDSDDYIEPDMYEKMMARAREFDCDVVMCDCIKEFPDHSALYTHTIRPGFYNESQLRTEYYPHLLMMENLEYPPSISNCLLLWKSRLNSPDMRYETGIRYSEDLLFGARLMRRARSFYYMKDEALYHYVMNSQSATHTFVPDKFEDYKRLHRKIQDAFSQDTVFNFRKQIDLCLLFFVYNAIGDIYGATCLSFGDKKEKILGILRDTAVTKMFSRLKIGRLPISFKQKLITFLYKECVGISALIKYYGG